MQRASLSCFRELELIERLFAFLFCCAWSCFNVRRSSGVTDDARIPALVCTHALHFTSFKEPSPELIGSRDPHGAALLLADQPTVAQPLHDAELVSCAGEVVRRLESTSLPVKEPVSKSALRCDASFGPAVQLNAFNTDAGGFQTRDAEPSGSRWPASESTYWPGYF